MKGGAYAPFSNIIIHILTSVFVSHQNLLLFHQNKKRNDAEL